MSITSLEYRHGASFSGKFRIRYPRRKVSRNGTVYYSFNLEDYSGKIFSYYWGTPPADCLRDLARVRVSGQIRELNNIWIANISSLESMHHEAESSVRLIPTSVCPLPGLLDKLQSYIASISNEALRNFAESVLANDNIAFPFVSIPASKSHHHATPGGLLQHSLDCFKTVSKFTEFSLPELELAQIGALFHDIGKTRTLTVNGKHTSAGYVVDHDSLTLEVLAPFLGQLDSQCQDAAVALRYLWTWRNRRNRNPIPIMTVAEAIFAADRISSGINIEKAAFQNHPDWHNFSRVGESQLVWRPRFESRMSAVNSIV